MIPHEKMKQHVRLHLFPLVFTTISGAHLYGFPSPDYDFDLRGAHLLPLETIVGRDEGTQTVEKEGIYDGLETDLFTHDAAKFVSLMLRRNGTMPTTTSVSRQHSGNFSARNHRRESNHCCTLTAFC
jgi:hypothetical protein